MLYCSIEDAWGKMPIKEQMEKYQNDEDINSLDNLENFDATLKKKINKNVSKKKIRKKYIIREKFDEMSEEENECSNIDSQIIEEEEQLEDSEYEPDSDETEYEEETEKEDVIITKIENRKDTSQIKKLKKKIDKLTKENNNLRLKLRKKGNNISNYSDILSNILTDKNREIIIISLIGIMIILLFHMMIKSSRN